jgi:hypothetical protein
MDTLSRTKASTRSQKIARHFARFLAREEHADSKDRATADSKDRATADSKDRATVELRSYRSDVDVMGWASTCSLGSENICFS